MSKFKVGAVVRTDDKTIIGCAVDSGYNPERLIVVRLDQHGYPVLEWESEKAFGWRPDLFELVTQAVAEQFIINTFDTNRTFASQEDAETYLKDNANVGYSFTISKVVRQGKIANSLVDAQ